MLRIVMVWLTVVLCACTTASPPDAPEPANPQDAAVWYYLSKERHKQFDDLIDHLEETIGKAMQEQRIPSSTSLRMAHWAELKTLPRKNMPWASFGAPATDKKRVIALEDSQEFSAIACNKHYDFTTARVPLMFGTDPGIVTLGPLSYSHTQIVSDGVLRPIPLNPKPPKGLYVKYRSGGEPSIFDPLYRDKPDLYEIQDETGRVVTKAEIQSRDEAFIEAVRDIDMNSSDCTAERRLG